jgi:glycosyltransferase involved in cell wall biosynthesis
MGSARFAAIIPNYNDGARIGAALSSLFGQTHPYDEILIIDDGSTDDSAAVIERLIAGHPEARLVRAPANKGIVATLNQGLRLVTADYVHMASANDTYHPRLLEYCAEALKAYPDTALLCGNATFRYKDTGREHAVLIDLPQAPHYVAADAFRARVRQSPLTFFGGGIVVRREAALSAGGLQESLRWHCDWMLYYELAFESGLYFIPEPLVAIEVAKGSYSSQARIWSRQREVIHSVITRISHATPAMRTQWKAAALLPTYNLRALTLLRRPECHWYVTPLLLWRLLVHSVAYRLKDYLPRPLLIRLRTIFRV